MKEGDVIEVRQIKFRGIASWEAWKPAVVRKLEHSRFAVQALHGSFDNEGNDILWLQDRGRGDQWR